MGALAPLLVVLGAQWPLEADGYETFQESRKDAQHPGASRSICLDEVGNFESPPAGSDGDANVSNRDMARPCDFENPTFEAPPISLTQPSQPSRPSRPPRLKVDPELRRRCQEALPDMVWVPRSALDLNFLRREVKVSKVILELTRDNVAALMVIATLSVFGAIYLWKICTRRRCLCKLCRNAYRSLDLLGAGGYGSVYLVERLPDLYRFVSKKIPVREITEVDEYSREAKELIMLRHRHIVSYEEDFVHVEYGGLEAKTYFIIIMEFCPEGDLKEKIEQDFLSFTEDWVRTIFAQLLQAVQYLHSKNVIHRDLKSQNVFLSQEGHVRLGDFGLCRHAPRQFGMSSMTHAGTDCYMAPEMLSSSRYGKPADIWSLGCILYELCSGQFMWELEGILGALVMKDSHAVQKLIQKEVAPAVGQEIKALLKRLLAANPATRPTATACIRKKLFKKGFSLSKQTFGQSLGEAVEDPPLEPLESELDDGEEEEEAGSTASEAESGKESETEATSPFSIRRAADPKKKRRKAKRGPGRRS